MNDPMDELEIEPMGEYPSVSHEDVALALGAVEVLPAERPLKVALTELFSDFPLKALLTFVPDVLLKRRLDTAAEKAEQIEVTAPGGMKAADNALAELQTAKRVVSEGFDYPVSLANQLHKRMTGLRADFLSRGETAYKNLADRVYREQRRLQEEEAQRRRVAQEIADRAVREAAARAANEATAKGASPVTVRAFEEQAARGTAPAVAVTPAPVLKSTTATERWKARLIGAVPEREPELDSRDMTAAELEQFKALVAAVAAGREKIETLNPNWSYLNERAKGAKGTLAITGIEPYDAGGLRAKPRR